MIDFIFTVGLTFGVGASTFALIFYVQALRDGVMDSSERGFLHSVFVVLRIGMILVGIALLATFITERAFTNVQSTQLALLIIITLNAILMTLKKMPMKLGPVLAGGSWYSLLIVSKTPITEQSVPMLVGIYIVFLVVFYFVFHFIRRKLSQTNNVPKAS